MLNINFNYIIIYFPIFLIFFLALIILLINYLFSVKNTIFLKNKTKKKNLKNIEIIKINLNCLIFFLLIINFIYFNLKIHNSIILNFKNYNFFLFFFSTFLFININYLLKQFNINYKKTINYSTYISIFFIIIIFNIFFINNFFAFLFFIELLSYIFYLQFLQIFNKIKTKNLKNYYLDSLLMFYWVNFFGTLFLILSLFILFLNFNTVEYYEIIYFSNYKNIINIFLFFFFIGFNIKLGISGFHFLKIEIYKNLKVDSIINFSFLSLFGYLILLKTINLILPFFFNFIFFIVFFIIFFIIFLFFNVKLKNIILFFGYSSIINASILLFTIL